MSSIRIDGRYYAAQVLKDVARETASLRGERSTTPGLALVFLGDTPAHVGYVQLKIKAAEEVGIHARAFNLPWDDSEPTLLALLRDLNQDGSFHGVFVQLPLPRGFDLGLVARAIEPGKDVDCMHPFNIGRVLSMSDVNPSASVAAVRELLARDGIEVAGRNVVICCQAGAPTVWALLAAILQADGCAAVIMCSPDTPGLTSMTRQADILVVDAGIPHFVRPEMVKEGATVIDVGQNVVPVTDGTRTTWRTVGDVDFKATSSKAGAISPVPGGVGPMVIATLMANTVKVARALTESGVSGRSGEER